MVQRILNNRRRGKGATRETVKTVMEQQTKYYTIKERKSAAVL